MEKVVHVVHCIDTEGPLYENLDAKFDRLEQILKVSGLERTQENFDRLKNGEIDLGGKEKLVRQVFSSHLLNYMDTWARLEEMLCRVTSEEFRFKITDSFGGPYLFNWFCVDHVGYDTNPRRRTLGYHAIFDYYRDTLVQQQQIGDGLHWHFHPMSTYREAHRCAMSLLNSPHIIETLARRIIERSWFPSCCRCGFYTERPDIHWFLEQYIPFDLTNKAGDDNELLAAQADLAGGRFGDWRSAPTDWSIYHPSHDYYQIPGNCRRWIGRALAVFNRTASINRCEVEKAFVQARNGKPTLLGMASHDYRDLAPEVDFLRQLLVEVQAQYPDVKFKFCEAKEAFREVAYGNELGVPLDLHLVLDRDEQGRPSVLIINTVQGKIFGPQPFLAIKTHSQRFIHDNLNFSADLKSWQYYFDQESILPSDVEAVGIGANDKFGNTVVEVIKV